MEFTFLKMKQVKGVEWSTPFNDLNIYYLCKVVRRNKKGLVFCTRCGVIKYTTGVFRQ